MANFPKVRIGDDVRAQHQLLTERFGLTSLALVVGDSMGAQQTYEWAVRYPEMVKRAAPIAGTAKNTDHDFLFTETLVEARRLLRESVPPASSLTGVNAPAHIPSHDPSGMAEQPQAPATACAGTVGAPLIHAAGHSLHSIAHATKSPNDSTTPIAAGRGDAHGRSNDARVHLYLTAALSGLTVTLLCLAPSSFKVSNRLRKVTEPSLCPNTVRPAPTPPLRVVAESPWISLSQT